LSLRLSIGTGRRGGLTGEIRPAALRFAIDECELLFLFSGHFEKMFLETVDIAASFRSDGFDEIGQRRVLIPAHSAHEGTERKVRGLHAEQSVHRIGEAVGMLSQIGHIALNGGELLSY
jgi:hypothetical protein